MPHAEAYRAIQRRERLRDRNSRQSGTVGIVHVDEIDELLRLQPRAVAWKLIADQRFELLVGKRGPALQPLTESASRTHRGKLSASVQRLVEDVGEGTRSRQASRQEEGIRANLFERVV